jgi:cyclophilin family peptidyl-prolyl cis-trans isomerase
MFRQLAASLAFGLCALAAHATNPQVELQTSLGVIVLELNAEAAPNTTANFIRYVQDGHYNGTIFHRVIPGFMIQGGGMDKSFREKQTRAPIVNEASNGLKNEIGAVAMARTSAPHSASAQFFINVANNAFLDFRSADDQGWGYAVFGKVIKGMDVVQKIAAVKTGDQGMHNDVPVTPIIIESARITAEPVPGKAPETKPVAKPAAKSSKK